VKPSRGSCGPGAGLDANHGFFGGQAPSRAAKRGCTGGRPPGGKKQPGGGELIDGPTTPVMTGWVDIGDDFRRRRVRCDGEVKRPTAPPGFLTTGAAGACRGSAGPETSGKSTPGQPDPRRPSGGRPGPWPGVTREPGSPTTPTGRGQAVHPGGHRRLGWRGPRGLGRPGRRAGGRIAVRPRGDGGAVRGGRAGSARPTRDEGGVAPGCLRRAGQSRVRCWVANKVGRRQERGRRPSRCGRSAFGRAGHGLRHATAAAAGEPCSTWRLKRAAPEAPPERQGHGRGPRRVALIGRPNVGKVVPCSTKLAGEQRAGSSTRSRGTTRGPGGRADRAGRHHLAVRGQPPGIRRPVSGRARGRGLLTATLRTQSALDRAEVRRSC